MYRPFNSAAKGLPKDVRDLQKEKAEKATFQAGKEALEKLQTQARDSSIEDLVLLLKQYGHCQFITESGKTVGLCLDWIALGTAQDAAKQKLVEDCIKRVGIFTPETPRMQRPGKKNQPKL